jgi:hypothetical protein
LLDRRRRDLVVESDKAAGERWRVFLELRGTLGHGESRGPQRPRRGHLDGVEVDLQRTQVDDVIDELVTKRQRRPVTLT